MVIHFEVHDDGRSKRESGEYAMDKITRVHQDALRQRVEQRVTAERPAPQIGRKAQETAGRLIVKLGTTLTTVGEQLQQIDAGVMLPGDDCEACPEPNAA